MTIHGVRNANKWNIIFSRMLLIKRKYNLIYFDNVGKFMSETLTLNPLNFWIIHLTFVGTVHCRTLYFRDIKMRTKSWSASSIKPGQTARMCRLARLYTGGKGLSLSFPAGWCLRCCEYSYTHTFLKVSSCQKLNMKFRKCLINWTTNLFYFQ